MRDPFQRVGLSHKDRMIIDLLEEILDELRRIRKEQGRATPSPS